jgi:SAM-dependent methyltransferase
VEGIFAELHAGLPKQGPGSDASTRRALALVPDLTPTPRVLDLGCGPGRQTLVLARETGGRVTAVDLEPSFLEEVRARAERAGLADRIETVRGDFGAPDVLEAWESAFDLVWCEGAVYCVGFAEGLAAWRRLLRPGGALAVSHVAWLADEPPERVRAFWDREYPDLASHEENLRVVAEQGYDLLGSFVLPDADWTEGYYDELEERIARLAERDLGEADRRVLSLEREEIDVFRERGGSYGYVFYAMRPSGS